MTSVPFTQFDCERWAASAWKRLNLSPPVDLAVVSEYLDITVRKRDFLATVYGLFLISSGGRRLICLNTIHKHPGRRRWTWAHEIGHDIIIKAMRKPPQPGRVCVLRTTDKEPKNLLERRCDQFAAALLMPGELIKAEYERLASNPSGRLPIIADKFGVSKAAMRVRVEELGIGTAFQKDFGRIAG